MTPPPWPRYANPNPSVYVSAVAANGIPVGSDSLGNGSAASPYATIAKAEANALPGQTILLNGLAASPTAYAAAALTASNTTIDSVQAFGAEITGSGSTDLYVVPKGGGTMTIGQVIIDAGNAQATAVALAPSASGAYSAIFDGTKIENFTSFGVVAEASNVSATFSGASLSSSAGAVSAIYFSHMTSGALDVENTTFNIKQALTDYGVINVQATAPGATVKVNNSNLAVTSASGTASGGYHFGVRLINVHGAVVENSAITIDASASPTWGAKAISIETALTGTIVDSGDFAFSNNNIYLNTGYSATAIEIGQEGDGVSSRGMFNGGVVYGNIVSGSAAAQLIESQGIFVGSQANTDVYGNTLTDLGIPLVDKDALNSVYYGNSISNPTLNGFLIKGSTHTTFVNNNLFIGDGRYNVYGIHEETNSDTGDTSSAAIISGNSLVSTASNNPLFVKIDPGQGAEFSGNSYRSLAPLGYEAWQWLGQPKGTYTAWQAASQERGGSYMQRSGQGETLNAYPLPVNLVAALTPAEKLSPYGLNVTGVTAGDASRTAASTGVIGIAVADTASHVGGDLNALETVAAQGELTSIVFTDPSTPTLSVQAGTLINDAAAVAVVAGAYHLSVNGALKALQATELAPTTLVHLAAGLTIQDTAADVTSDLDSLQTLAAAGELGAVGLTDPATAILAITAVQLQQDAKALADVQTAHDLLLSGPIDNVGTTFLGAASVATGLLIGVAGVSLTGGGTLSLGSSGKNSILGASSAAVLTNVAGYISGAGDVGEGELTLSNEAAGVIAGVYATTLVVDTGSNIILNAGRIENIGTGGTILKSAVNNTGALIAEGASLTVNGAVTGSGEALIYSGTLDFTSSFSQTVAFKASSGVLELARSQGFAGAIYGFSTTGATSLDLRDIAFGGATQVSFSGTTSSGVLTVTDGSHTAHIHLAGNYASSTFAASGDGQGGTVVTAAQAGMSNACWSPLPSMTAAAHFFVATAAGLGAKPVASDSGTTRIPHLSSVMLAMQQRSTPAQ